MHRSISIGLLTLIGCGGSVPTSISNNTTNVNANVAVDLQQSPLRPSLAPRQGEHAIASDIASRPMRLPVDFGGEWNLERYNVGQHCVGYIENAPSVNLVVQAPAALVRLFVEVGSGDAALIVRKPDGTFACNDDGGGEFRTVPLVELTDAQPGTYNVWVANALSQTTGDGELVVTADSSLGAAGPQNRVVGDQPSANSLDRTSTAGIPSHRLGANFRPYSTQLAIGGPVGALLENLPRGRDCRGLLPQKPSQIIELTAAAPFIRFTTSATQNRADPTLVILGPNNEWYCNDDAVEMEASVELNNAPVGAYRVWIGDRNSETAHPRTTLTVTRELSPNAIDRAGTTRATARLNANFSPQHADVVAGGPVRVADQNITGDQCRGNVSQAPSYLYDVRAAMPFVRFYVSDADVDTTLVVLLPNGEWMCNDDSFGTQLPSVDLNDVGTGQYRVWVGTYNNDATPRVRLNATRDVGQHPQSQ